MLCICCDVIFGIKQFPCQGQERCAFLGSHIQLLGQDCNDCILIGLVLLQIHIERRCNGIDLHFACHIIGHCQLDRGVAAFRLIQLEIADDLGFVSKLIILIGSQCDFHRIAGVVVNCAVSRCPCDRCGAVPVHFERFRQCITDFQLRKRDLRLFRRYAVNMQCPCECRCIVILIFSDLRLNDVFTGLCDLIHGISVRIENGHHGFACIRCGIPEEHCGHRSIFIEVLVQSIHHIEVGFCKCTLDNRKCPALVCDALCRCIAAALCNIDPDCVSAGIRWRPRHQCAVCIIVADCDQADARQTFDGIHLSLLAAAVIEQLFRCGECEILCGQGAVVAGAVIRMCIDKVTAAHSHLFAVQYRIGILTDGLTPDLAAVDCFAHSTALTKEVCHLAGLELCGGLSENIDVCAVFRADCITGEYSAVIVAVCDCARRIAAAHAADIIFICHTAAVCAVGDCARIIVAAHAADRIFTCHTAAVCAVCNCAVINAAHAANFITT